MGSLVKHWPRILVTLLPLVFALLHATGIARLGVLDRLDNIIYDARLRATMPRTLDERVVIVDIDEKSLAQVGRWPWGRNRMAELTTELFERQQIALLGFDIVFAEPDESSGFKRLTELAQRELRDQPGLAEKIRQLQPVLDYDALFAKSLDGQPAVLGYYLTGDRDGHTSGLLPKPVMDKSALQGQPIKFTNWNGYGANIAPIARAAPIAGYFNSIPESDGVVRAMPLIAEYQGRYYESLSLAMFRLLVGMPSVAPGFPKNHMLSPRNEGLASIQLTLGARTLAIPVDEQVATLIPFRGFGGPKGGSFRYVSAGDLLSRAVPAETLKGKIVLVGTTAPGLQDLRVAPLSEAYPGVELHANLISGLLDGMTLVKPDYAIGYEVMVLLFSGLILAFALPLMSAAHAVILSVVVLAGVGGLNLWLYRGSGLVLPLAGALLMGFSAFALSMGYGYLAESRSKRKLAHLFGTYVPPELVDEMVKDPDRYSMQASKRELTVMFCDLRGFTKMSEQMEPIELQALLNCVFTRLTGIIRANRGTIDKYMGDCVMAFWGAPVEIAEHAHLAVKSALEMARAIHRVNEQHRAKGLPEIGIGIGVNTGKMCVGDMGSNLRRSYTVIGDAVNLGSRLEGLSKIYAVDTVVSESTRKLVPAFGWQELDLVRVNGKAQAVAIFWPVAPANRVGIYIESELKTWASFLKAYRAQDWDQCDLLLLKLMRMNAKKYLYHLYSERVASMRLLPLDFEWDGATNFETK